MLSDDRIEDSIILYNNEMVSVVNIEYEKMNNSTITKDSNGNEYEAVGLVPFVHWVTIKADVWLDDCGELLCSGVRPFEARSPYIDIRGEFSLEGASRENDNPKYTYMFRSFGEVEVTLKGTK